MGLRFRVQNPITLGVPNLNNANGLKGIIDEIRISNVARTEAEIQEAMDVGLAAILNVEPRWQTRNTVGIPQACTIAPKLLSGKFYTFKHTDDLVGVGLVPTLMKYKKT